jgi:hypothetical protein
MAEERATKIYSCESSRDVKRKFTKRCTTVLLS